MYKKLVLKNDFHNSTVTFRVQLDEVKEGNIIYLSENQVKKAQRLLCGINFCTCSGELGMRSEWYELDGENVKLSQDPIYNNRTGKIEGCILHIDRIW